MVLSLNLEVEASYSNTSENKNIKSFKKYLIGVKCIIDSIRDHGYVVAKIFFLNPVQCTCFSHLNQPESEPIVNSEDGVEIESRKKLNVANIEKTVHYCNEEKMKINDLQNFVNQNTKYLLKTYPEFGKDIFEIETTLLEMLSYEPEILESK